MRGGFTRNGGRWEGLGMGIAFMFVSVNSNDGESDAHIIANTGM